jgi:predicted phage tail protein
VIINYSTLIPNGAGIVVLSIFGYYAIKLLSSFRKGMLERGWKLTVYGAVFLGVAQIPFIASALSAGNFSIFIGYVGSALRFLGIVFLILGFRAQYQIWKADKRAPTQSWESHGSIER